MRFNVLLLILLIGCADSSTSGPGRDAATDAPVDAAPAVQLDAAAPANDIDPTRIYAIEECPQRVLPTGLAIVPTAGPGVCEQSSDCTLQPNGICQGYERDSGVIEYPRCNYEGCSSLAPCPADLHCQCSFHGVRRCLSVGCAGDDTCLAGQRCERTMTGCNYQQLGDYLCTRADDQCLTHDDCTEAGLGNWCVVENARRICISHTCD
jgi:hypothetical protein